MNFDAFTVAFGALRYLSANLDDRPESFTDLPEHEIVRRYCAIGQIKIQNATFGFTANIVPFTREVLRSIHATCTIEDFILYLTEDGEYSLVAKYLVQGGGQWELSLCGSGTDLCSTTQTADGLLLELNSALFELRHSCKTAGIEYMSLLQCCPGQVSTTHASTWRG
jgi:hypothetical protein